jgi:hypothetical protein
MAKQTINIGTSANDGTGDPLRTAFDKINDNFTELYTDDEGDVNSVTGSGGLEVDQTTGAVTVSISDSGVTTAKINADAVDGTKIADDSIDSEHIADGSIDEPHLNATNAPTDGYVLTYDSTTTGFTWEEKFDGDITGIVAGAGLTGDATSGDASLAVGAGTGITVNANDVQISDGGVGSTQLASSAITNAKINNGAVNIDKLSATLLVTESEGIGSNDNDTTLPTSAAVKDYVDSATGGIGVSVISTNTTASSGNLYVLTANLTLTLPASPNAGDYVKVSNRSGVATCTIARNSENIMGAASDLTLDKLNSGFELIYSGSAQGWVLIGVEGA